MYEPPKATRTVYSPFGSARLGTPNSLHTNAGEAQPSSIPQTIPLVKNGSQSAQKLG